MTDAAISDNIGDSTEDTVQETIQPVEGNWRVQAGIEDASLDKFESVDALAKSYRELETYRSNSIRIPTSEAGEEQWNEFNEKLVSKVPGLLRMDESNMDNIFQQLGRPESPDGYQFEEVPGIEPDSVSTTEFSKIAHENGLSAKQANAMHKWLAENIASEAIEMQESYESQINALKSEWGVAFDSKLEQAKAATNMLDGKIPGLKDWLDETGNNADPMYIRLMATLADQFGEKELNMPPIPDGVMTPDEARMKISDMRNNPDHAYNNELDTGHEAAKREVMRLYKIANGRLR
jgi:hypothetical protein